MWVAVDRGPLVFSTRYIRIQPSFLSGPAYNGARLSYSNRSSLNENWQLEPSLNYYTLTDNIGSNTDRWTPGWGLTYCNLEQVSRKKKALV